MCPCELVPFRVVLKAVKLLEEPNVDILQCGLHPREMMLREPVREFGNKV